MPMQSGGVRLETAIPACESACKLFAFKLRQQDLFSEILSRDVSKLFYCKSLFIEFQLNFIVGKL